MAVVSAFFTAGILRADGLQPPTRQRVEDRIGIEQLLTDHTLYGYYVGGQPWSEYHSPDGRTAYQENNCVYAGHWWVEQGLVCFRYEAFNHGQPACFQLYRVGDRLEFDYRQGASTWKLNAYTVDRRQGNPDKMPLDGQSCVGV
jgi:hypothetical protein